MIDYFAIVVMYFGGEWLKSYLRKQKENNTLKEGKKDE